MASLLRTLRQKSKQICRDNECSGGHHNCESCAYIDRSMKLLDICTPRYFFDLGAPCASVKLPWAGDFQGLKAEVKNQLAEWEMENIYRVEKKTEVRAAQ